jgi:cytochrome c oxidase accessory protein FixG
MNASARTDASLYAAREKIHAREVSGRYERLRVVAVCALLGFFYGLPWLQWRGHQAVLFDLPARKFHIFGLVFFPQDFFLLAWLLIIAAVSLFFFTTLAGRLWCGYACPQTVWTHAFVAMERWCEGDRQRRIKLDRAPWTAQKLARKSAKQVLWLTFAAFTGMTFVGYFSAIRELAPDILSASLGGWETFWVVFYGFATYGNAGYMREQVCKYMCPYARFQSAMFDKNTLIISYDTARGEPRGSRGRNVDPRAQGLGDCIDCTLCVQVCPTGIDIRKGLQLECIACAACIDACDDVMQKMRYAPGLIRYATQASIDGGKTRIVRPRVIIYAAVLLALVIGFAIAVARRQVIEADVIRDRNTLFREMPDGTIENVYTVRLINKDTQTHALRLQVHGLDGATLDSEQREYSVGGGEIISVPVRIRVPRELVSGSVGIQIVVSSPAGNSRQVSAEARFIAPPRRAS